MDDPLNKSNTPQSTHHPNKHCTQCNKTFSTSINLKNHIMTVHDKHFPFKCPYTTCTKAYSIETRLKAHLKTHVGNKSFICSVCGKGFVEKGNLKTHVRFHSALRPYKCSLCDKSYKTKGHLKDHIDIQHYDIKKYHCDICGSCFGRSSTLKAHIRTHMGVKNIKCLIEGCDKYFSEKGNMLIHYKRHLMKVHKEEKGVINVNVNEHDVDAALTRPESNVTLVNEEGKRVEMDLTFDVYDKYVDDDDDVEFIENNVNVNDDMLVLNDSKYHNMKLNGEDVQYEDKGLQLNEFDNVYI